jgi:hypothetical protein
MPMSPALSIVVVSFNRAALLEQCLDSLCGQARDAAAEILVVRAGEPQGPEWDILRRRFVECVWVFAPSGSTVPRLRQVGMSAAKADILGLLEDDCVVDGGWCQAVHEAHRGPWAAVGGAVEPGPYRRSRDWAVYLYEYARFMLPFEPGPAEDLPGNNVSYKREALQGIANPDPDGFYDVSVHQEWRRLGWGLLRTPTLVVENRNFWPLSYLTAAAFHHGRGFAAKQRAALPPAQRVVRALLAPFLPVLQVYRLARLTLARRRLVGRLVRALPATLVFSGSWAAGECLGYLTGPGSSLQRWR